VRGPTSHCGHCLAFAFLEKVKLFAKWPHLAQARLGMCGMDFSSSVRIRFGFEKNCGFVRFGFLCRSVVKYKKTCKLSFLCVHFVFLSTVF